jgi:hypothetical protein
MSNALAVAATTATLVNLLVPVSPNVTALPPDKAHDEGVEEQLNVFLYSIGLSPAWRNSDPIGSAPGETGPSPLPLVLRYLVTAYASNEVKAHALLGGAMSVFHDHPLLGSDEILDATTTDLSDSDLHLQPERVRLTPVQVSLHDMSELWSGFATSYRVSQAYEACVVLIDSTQARSAPLPVLRQGPGDDAPLAVPGPGAVLMMVLPADGASTATLGGGLRLLGTGLEAVTGVRLRTRRLPAPIVLTPSVERTATELAVDLPSPDAALATWVAGIHDVSLLTQRPGLPLLVSGSRPFGLGPTITVAPATVPAGDVALTLTARPRIRTEQEVEVLLGSGPPVAAGTVTTPADPAQPSTVTVTFPGVSAGSHVVRLRVDGVDSDPVTYVGSPPRPEFDPAAQVVVT